MGAMSPNPLLRPGQFSNLTQVVAGSSAESNLFWALVYVPQGQLQGHSTSQLQGQLQAACTNPTSLS